MLDFTFSTSEEICGELGQRLRARRLMLGWSQADLAQRAGLSAGTVKNLEQKGQASLVSFIEIVYALGLASDLNDVFKVRLHSIAAMEKAQQARRQRAPRKAQA